MKILYLDESGDHNLVKLDKDQYRVFVLGGVIVDRKYARTVIEPYMREVKLEFFGREDIVFHTADIVRAKNGFEVLKDTVFRDRFYEALNVMMRTLEYQVVACVIRKDRHVARYGNNAADPYYYSLDIVVERFCKELRGTEDGGIIVAEKRDPKLDDALNRTWEGLKTNGAGTGYIDSKTIDERIIDLSLKDKYLNIAGLQMADLVVTPIGRHILGKPDQEDWRIVESKFCRRGTWYIGYGLVVLPR